MVGAKVGETIDDMGMLMLAAPAMPCMVTVVAITSGDARDMVTDTVDHYDVSHTCTFTVEATAMPTAVGDMIVDTNGQDMGDSTIQVHAGDDMITCGAGNDMLFGNTDAVLGAVVEASDNAVHLGAPAVYAVIAELHTFGMGVTDAAAVTNVLRVTVMDISTGDDMDTNTGDDMDATTIDY